MSDDPKHPDIKITDRRHFDITGSRRADSESSPEPARTSDEKPAQARTDAPAGRPLGEGPAKEPAEERPVPRPEASGLPADGGAPPAPPGAERDPRADSDRAIPRELADLASGISSGFSLLVARLAQETEIYLGLVPYPGKETAEPDLEAARAMIDMLSMLQEKTRGNLEPEETHLLDNLLYAYRLEFVRLRSDGGVR